MRRLFIFIFFLIAGSVIFLPSDQPKLQAYGDANSGGSDPASLAIYSVSPDPATNTITVSGVISGGTTYMACSQGFYDSANTADNPQYNISGGSSGSYGLTVTQSGTGNYQLCSDTIAWEVTPGLNNEYSFSFNVDVSGLTAGSHNITVSARIVPHNPLTPAAPTYTVSDSASFTKDGGAYNGVIVGLTANGESPSTNISYNSSATLAWSVSVSPPSHLSSTTCTASVGWSGSKSNAGGSQSTGNLTQTKSYQLDCTDNAANPPLSGSASVTVNVAAPPTGDFTISCSPPTYSINPGDSAGYGVTVSGSGGFSDNVMLGASGVPTPASSSFTTNPISGSGSSILSIGNTGGVSPGSYTITVFGQGQTTGISHSSSCNFQVNSPATFSYFVSPSSLSFSATQNGALPASQNITITNSGNQTLTNFSVSRTQSWLNVPSPATIASLAAGASATVAIAVNTTAFAPNTYSDTVTVSQSQTGNQTVSVSYVISGAGTASYSLSPVSRSFSATQNGSVPAAQTFRVINTGTATLSGMTVSKTATWLNAPTSPLASIAPGTFLDVNIVINTTNLPPSTYSDSITFSHAQAGVQTGAVTYTVAVASSTSGALSIVSISPNPADASVTVTGAAQGPGVQPSRPSSCAGGFKYDPKTMTASGWSIAGGGSGSYALTQTQAGVSAFVTNDIHCQKYQPYLYNFTQPFSINTSALANGTYNLTISALGGDGVTYSDTKPFTVAHPDFSVSCVTLTQTVTQGGSTSYSVHSDSANGFSSAVTFSLVSAPAGVSTAGATLTPTGDTALPVSVAASTAAATYTLTVKGMSGSLSHTCTTQLIVNALPLPTASLTVNQTHAPSAVNYNSNVTLGWSSSNSTSCSITSNPNIGTWNGLSQADPPGITTPALTADTTFTQTCTGAGGSAQDSIIVNLKPGDPPLVRNFNYSMDNTVPCSVIKITWTAAQLADSYKVFQDSNPIPIKDFGYPASPANPTYFNYPGAGGSSHTYSVQAYRGAGASLVSNKVAASNVAPITSTPCGTNLSTSDKDITAVKGITNQAASPCNGVPDAVAVDNLKLIKVGDTVTFKISVCNNTGTAAVNNFTLTDTTTALAPVVGSFDYGTSACAGKPQPTISGSDGTNTINFDFGGGWALPAGGICSITYSATVTVPAGNSQSYLHFQNSYQISGTDAGTGLSVGFAQPRHTGLILFSTGVNVAPKLNELSP